jgi:hypothetical protein
MLPSRRAFVVLAVVGGLLTAGQAAITPAAGSVTLGQLSVSPSGSCQNADFAQLSVAAGPSYTVPSNGTITSWSHSAIIGTGQMLSMKVLRAFAPGNFYKVIGLDGPRPLISNLLNIFTVNIPVQTGDILDLDSTGTSNGCTFTGVPADNQLTHSGYLNNGDAAGFFPSTGVRLNLSAVFVPTNTVTFGTTALNKKRGTATLNLTLPNAGELSLSGDGIKPVTQSSPAGAAQLLITATGKKKKRLKDKHKVTLSPTITFTPANGDPGTQTTQVKLKKK